jgi:hypothetical protein
MKFRRPTNPTALSKDQKISLLKDYVTHCQRIAAADPNALNQKVPRDAFSDLLDHIGELLLRESQAIATSGGEVANFLDATPLPQSMERLLPRQFRAYCLALNALKQWVAAEQAATDKFLLGGNIRRLCRAATERCIVTGDVLDSDLELHHPVRDGRPPIPLSKRGHDLIEGQTKVDSDDPVEASLVALKRRSNWSWAMLQRGCLDLLGKPTSGGSLNTAASARTFARKASQATNLSYNELLDWLDVRGRSRL